jgi:hypothetical protein
MLEMPPGHPLSDLGRENLSEVEAYPIVSGSTCSSRYCYLPVASARLTLEKWRNITSTLNSAFVRHWLSGSQIRFGLEDDTGSELDLAGLTVGSYGGDVAEVASGRARNVGRGEDGVVERVEGFEAELQKGGLGEVEVLQD